MDQEIDLLVSSQVIELEAAVQPPILHQAPENRITDGDMDPHRSVFDGTVHLKRPRRVTAQSKVLEVAAIRCSVGHLALLHPLEDLKHAKFSSLLFFCQQLSSLVPQASTNSPENAKAPGRQTLP